LQEREVNFRDPGDCETLISEWLRYAESGDKDLFWAYESLAELIDDDPPFAYKIVLELVHRPMSEGVFDLAAAGPLEDLIAWHGRDVIDIIEQEVIRDETLRRALSRVWLNESDLESTILDRYTRLGVQRLA
jgi:hypothetical protein